MERQVLLYYYYYLCIIIDVLTENWEIKFLHPRELTVTVSFWPGKASLLCGTSNGAYSPVRKSVTLNGFSHFQRSKVAEIQLDPSLPAFYSSHCLFPSAWWCKGHPCTLELFALCLFTQQSSWKALIKVVFEGLYQGPERYFALSCPSEIFKCFGLLKAKVEHLY